MNVSAELIESLSNQLTPEQFKAFKYAVRLENSPQAALIDKWNGTPEWEDFMEALVAREDECGFITNASVIEVLNTNPELLYACRVKINGDWCYLVGLGCDLEEVCKRDDVTVKTAPCVMSADNFTSWAGDDRQDIVKGLTQCLCALGILNRTEYIKDYHGGTRRCHKIVK